MISYEPPSKMQQSNWQDKTSPGPESQIHQTRGLGLSVIIFCVWQIPDLRRPDPPLPVWQIRVSSPCHTFFKTSLPLMLFAVLWGRTGEWMYFCPVTITPSAMHVTHQCYSIKFKDKQKRINRKINFQFKVILVQCLMEAFYIFL